MTRPWGTSLRQRARLAPLYLAVALADRIATSMPRRRRKALGGAWDPGVSVVIPDRDAPELLAEALASVEPALGDLDEPHQIIVVANGAPRPQYAEIARRHPNVEILHDASPCGFSTAIDRGLRRAHFDWTLLLNNDMTLEASALVKLACHRDADVFAIAPQILQRSADGRREETGFVDWYVDAGGIRVYHAPVPEGGGGRAHLCASGGAGLFRTMPLRRYVREARAYDPFYWEDVEWGVRAMRDGLRVLYCAEARATHRHRATASRFYSAAEIERVVERNRLLFDLRNAITRCGAPWLLERVCDQPYTSQRELASPLLAAKVLRHRWRARRQSEVAVPPVLAAPREEVTEPGSSFSYALGVAAAKPRVLLVTPFCIFPPRHGGARRVEGLLVPLRAEYYIVLVSDEASLYDARSFRHFDGLRAVKLVQRRERGTVAASDEVEKRIDAHCHLAMVLAVRQALWQHRPDLVQIEHVELAALSRLRMPGQRWVLALHDAYGNEDFRDPKGAARLHKHIAESFDAVTVCSVEDAAMIRHPRTVRVPNATSIAPLAQSSGTSSQLLFMGPFRYANNFEGIRRFLRVAYPRIKDAVPAASLVVLGGDGAPEMVAGDPAFAQAGVNVLGHRDDVREFLLASALTVNPLSGIRGSALKVIESIVAGRVCVSTEDGARGFTAEGLSAMITARDVAAMTQPIIRLLSQPGERHRIESPDTSVLERFRWERSAAIQSRLYRELLEPAHG